VTAEYAQTQWDRALEAFRSAQLLVVHGGFDSAASRAYYAAFHAVSSLFALEGQTFTKHSAVEAAVHRDLVKAGRWPTNLGRDYSLCADVRSVGDYGTEVRVDANQAMEAIKAARRILLTVHDALPTYFPALPAEDERGEKS
jgi:uncharacterized protein (UPF0332 family)